MDYKDLEDKKQRATADAPEPSFARSEDDADSEAEEKRAGAEDAPDERIVFPAWWEDGAVREEQDADARAVEFAAAGDEPHIPRGPRLYRGVSYGAPAPEQKSGTAEEPGKPVDLSVVAPVEISEEPPAVFPAEGGDREEPVVESSWWDAGSRHEEEAKEKAAAEPEPLGKAGYTYRGVRYGEPAPEADPGTAQGPDHDDDPVDLFASAGVSEDPPAVPPEDPIERAVGSPFWSLGSAPAEAAGEDPATEHVPEPDSRTAQEPDYDHGPAETSVLAERLEDVPAAGHEGPKHPVEEPEPLVVPSPFWALGSRLDEPAGEQPATERIPEPQSRTAQEPDPQLAAPPTPEREAPAYPADRALTAETPPDGPPSERIRSIVAEVCPGELLLVGTAEAALPEWAGAAASAAREDLDGRLADGKRIGGREHLQLAIVENVLGLHDDADRHLKQALPRSEPFGPVLNALAVTSLARGRIAPAVVYCKEALRETGGDDATRAAASSNLGDLYELQGNSIEAAEAYETAIHCLSAEGNSSWLSRLHLKAGRHYRRSGEADKARLHLSDSARLFKELGDDSGQVRALAELGSVLNESGLHDIALRSLEEGVRICLRTGDRPGAALVQDGIGTAYMGQDQLTRALAYFEGALLLHRELGNPEGEAATLHNIGKIHESRGDTAEAQQFYAAARKINGEQDEPADAAAQSDSERGDGDDQDDASARFLKAQEFLRRAESTEPQ